MDTVLKIAPLFALKERLAVLQRALRAALADNDFERAAGIERERALAVHELFERDFGLSAAALRELAVALLEEQHQIEAEVADRRIALASEHAELTRNARSAHAYRAQADMHASTDGGETR